MENPLDMIEPVFHIDFRVTAYDDGGYGDERSKSFGNAKDAIDYAKSLEPRFGASVRKIITMDRISLPVYP